MRCSSTLPTKWILWRLEARQFDKFSVTFSMLVKSREFKATGKISLTTRRNFKHGGGKEVQSPGGPPGFQK